MLPDFMEMKPELDKSGNGLQEEKVQILFRIGESSAVFPSQVELFSAEIFIPFNLEPSVIPSISLRWGLFL